ncbi:MAG: hypothetical protein M3R21_05765 [Candidatus Dormibacteraeota bacterium]|nr:hypothetical protein [Candidatus Dormibacteraeota bacterium]
MTAGKVRIPHAHLIVGSFAILVGAAILWLSRTYTFYFDEWSFILTAPDWTLATYFQPHNEHPSMLLRVVYAALLNTVGLRSYVPYMAVLMLIHIANVLLLFGLIRARAGDLVALWAAALFLLLGAGWEDLLWAFQLAWLASLALGMATLYVLQAPSTPGRLAIAAGLLSGSLMFSGIGVVFAAAVMVMLAVTPARRRDLAWFFPVGVALAVWYIAFGRLGERPNPGPTAANVLLVPAYALWGLATSAAGIIGEGGWVSVPLLLVAASALGWAWTRQRPDALALGVAAGLVTFYVVTGMSRAQLGYTQSGSSRYVYVGAALWLIVLADAGQRLPWRGTWRPALVACVFLACFNSTALLFSFATAKTVLMQREVADLYALAAERSDPCLKPNGTVDPYVMPPVDHPALYYRAADRYGDPRVGLPLRDLPSYDEAIRNLRKPGC